VNDPKNVVKRIVGGMNCDPISGSAFQKIEHGFVEFRRKRADSPASFRLPVQEARTRLQANFQAFRRLPEKVNFYIY